MLNKSAKKMIDFQSSAQRKSNASVNLMAMRSILIELRFATFLGLVEDMARSKTMELTSENAPLRAQVAKTSEGEDQKLMVLAVSQLELAYLRVSKNAENSVEPGDGTREQLDPHCEFEWMPQRHPCPGDLKHSDQ